VKHFLGFILLGFLVLHGKIWASSSSCDEIDICYNSPIVSYLKEEWGIPEGFWRNPTVKQVFKQILQKHFETLVRLEKSELKELIYGELMIKIGHLSISEEDESRIKIFLDFGEKVPRFGIFYEDSILCIPNISRESFPHLFEDEYREKKTSSFWQSQEIVNLKNTFFSEAVTLFFEPYDKNRYRSFGEKVMTKVKKTKIFYPKDSSRPKKKMGISPLKASSFMRSLGLSTVDLTSKTDQDTLIKGTRIRGQMLPKINLGRNKRRKIMIYDWHQKICFIKKAPQ
jgi:hypothetical protein